MSRFLTNLDCRALDDRRWELLGPLVYESDVAKMTVIVPKGFVTDLASVPRIPLVYTLFGDRAHYESVPHDYLYQTHLTSKAIADKVFREAMGVRGKSRFVVWAMYAGVVIGGGPSYRVGPRRFQILNGGGDVSGN